MKKIYKDIWKLAKPYYKIGRPQDIDHIVWMIQDALKVCKAEKIDETILLPLVILHDVGYSQIPKDNSFKIIIRKSHMQKGAKLAKEILEKLNYSINKTEKISYYVSVHDNWALGDNIIYKKDKILGTFNDLDFIWMTTKKGFDSVRKIMKKKPQEMLEWVENNEKLIKRPFKTKIVKKLWKKYLTERKKELNEKK